MNIQPDGCGGWVDVDKVRIPIITTNKTEPMQPAASAELGKFYDCDSCQFNALDKNKRQVNLHVQKIYKYVPEIELEEI